MKNRCADRFTSRGRLFTTQVQPRRALARRGSSVLIKLNTLAFLATLVFAAYHPARSQAQVLEVGDGGAVTVYDRPAVFTAAGASPIQTRTSPIRAQHAPAKADHVEISQAANAAALSPALIEAVAWQESRMTPRIVSPAGAIGEMQLMPATARALGVDPLDTRQNFNGGAAYLRSLMQHYNGDLIRSLAAYNAGAGAVDRYGGVPPYKETQAYVANIMARLSLQVSTDVAPQPSREK